MSTPNLSLRKKSSARAAAVQVLYRAEVRGEKREADTLLKRYGEHLDALHDKDAKKLGLDAPPDKPLFAKLVETACGEAEAIESELEKLLASDWKKARVNVLLLALLRVALAERRLGKLAQKPWVAEYTGLAHRFVSEQEAGFVNAALQSVHA